MATAQTGQKRLDIDALLEVRGMSRATVAARAGIQRATLREQISKGFPLKKLRLVIEGIIDTPIWSSEADFIRRKALRLRLNFDAWTISAGELRRFTPGLKIKGWRNCRQRGELIALLERQFLTQNQNTVSNP